MLSYNLQIIQSTIGEVREEDLSIGQEMPEIGEEHQKVQKEIGTPNEKRIK